MPNLHNSIVEFKIAIQALYNERLAIDPSLDRLEQAIMDAESRLKIAKTHMEKEMYQEIKKSLTDTHIFAEEAYGNYSPSVLTAIYELFDLVGNLQ